jgi:hypothetical protein
MQLTVGDRYDRQAGVTLGSRGAGQMKNGRRCFKENDRFRDTQGQKQKMQRMPEISEIRIHTYTRTHARTHARESSFP